MLNNHIINVRSENLINSESKSVIQHTRNQLTQVLINLLQTRVGVRLNELHLAQTINHEVEA
jgi:hypothetical protein